MVLGDAQFRSTRTLQPRHRPGPPPAPSLRDPGRRHDPGLQRRPDRGRSRMAAFRGPGRAAGADRYIPVPGNHDVPSAAAECRCRLERLYEQRWGPLYFSFVYKNALLSGSTATPRKASTRSPATSRRWLAKHSPEATRAQVPLHAPPSDAPENAQALHELARAQGVSQSSTAITITTITSYGTASPTR